MSRLNFTEEEATPRTLEELIPQYAENKNELDSYKKICDRENAQIKNLMAEEGINEKEAGGYTAKCSVTKRESMNEERLIEILKKHNVPNVVKTKEYVDMEALENYLYKADLLPTNLFTDIDSCREITEVVTLRVSMTKKKKEE